jgi:octaprenyl-diphosphate synthase
MMVRAQSMAIMDLLANTTNTIAQGEVLQLLNIRDPDTSETRYEEIIYAKTACLFEAAARIGALLGEAGEATENALRDYGRHLGVAFQLIDDVLDYSADSDTLGKNVGDDLAEGKPTLPLIRAMATGNDAQRSLIRAAIESGKADNFDEINRAIVDTGALQYTIDQAHREAALAKQSIAELSDGDHKQALLFLAEYAVERNH